MTGITATVDIDIAVPPEQVWQVLTDPAEVRGWMFGADLETDWQVGSAITWSGEYEGKAYADKGEVVTYDEPRELVVTHFSPLTGHDDVPENYHTLTFGLEAVGDGTHLTLSQDNNGSEEEAEASKSNWQQAVEGIKGQAE